MIWVSRPVVVPEPNVYIELSPCSSVNPVAAEPTSFATYPAGRIHPPDPFGVWVSLRPSG